MRGLFQRRSDSPCNPLNIGLTNAIAGNYARLVHNQNEVEKEQNRHGQSNFTLQALCVEKVRKGDVKAP